MIILLQILHAALSKKVSFCLPKNLTMTTKNKNKQLPGIVINCPYFYLPTLHDHWTFKKKHILNESQQYVPRESNAFATSVMPCNYFVR